VVASKKASSVAKKASCVAAFKKSAPSTAGTHTGGVVTVHYKEEGF